MSNIRSQIERDEKELGRIGLCRRETCKLREYNNRQTKELRQLEFDYGNDEHELRRVVAKVDSLRGQLETLYMRRAAASDIAIAQHRRCVNNGTIMSSPQEKTEGRISTIQNERRPKASISPFNKAIY